MLLLCIQSGHGKNIVVCDSVDFKPLQGATAFDQKGSILGHSNQNGKLPYIPNGSFPITIRYLGFEEKTVNEYCDTIYLKEIATELPEVIVESKSHKVLHVLAYVREYSTLSTYTDTVFLFREKMVDYMLSPDKKTKFNGWKNPRLLKSNSYYRFTNNHGLDSVSDKCRYHFSWSDWINIVPSPQLPLRLKGCEIGRDSIFGKYSPTEIWNRNGENITVDINVLADTISRKWVPNLQNFFHSHLDYENLRIRYNYSNVVGDSIAMTDITGYSYSLSSNGRGHNMFMFNKTNEPFFVTTYAEVYIVDKEYIKIKEAKQWARMSFNQADMVIIEPKEAPNLQPSINELIARVNRINHTDVRQNIEADIRLKSRNVHKQQHIGQRMLSILKGVTGISSYKSKKNLKRNWNNFKNEQIKRNNE